MPAKTHGKSRGENGRHTKEYKAWIGMKDRCFNPKNQYFHCYGGRGITVTPKWVDSFEAFYAHVGNAPSAGHSLGRIENDGNYEPGNVEWQTQAEQNVNRRNLPRRWFKFEALMPQIKAMAAEGLSTRKIAAALGVGKSRVWKVLNEA